MKALVAAFNQEKALAGAFSVIVKLHRLIVYTVLSTGSTSCSVWTGTSRWRSQRRRGHSSSALENLMVVKKVGGREGLNLNLNFRILMASAVRKMFQINFSRQRTFINYKIQIFSPFNYKVRLSMSKMHKKHQVQKKWKIWRRASIQRQPDPGSMFTFPPRLWRVTRILSSRGGFLKHDVYELNINPFYFTVFIFYHKMRKCSLLGF